MCLSDVGRVVAVDAERHSARLDVGDRTFDVSTVALGLDAPPVAVGDWLVVHTGLAVERLDPDAARRVVASRTRLASSATTDSGGAAAPIPAREEHP